MHASGIGFPLPSPQSLQTRIGNPGAIRNVRSCRKFRRRNVLFVLWPPRYAIKVVGPAWQRPERVIFQPYTQSGWILLDRRIPIASAWMRAEEAHIHPKRDIIRLRIGHNVIANNVIAVKYPDLALDHTDARRSTILFAERNAISISYEYVVLHHAILRRRERYPLPRPTHHPRSRRCLRC